MKKYLFVFLQMPLTQVKLGFCGKRIQNQEFPLNGKL